MTGSGSPRRSATPSGAGMSPSDVFARRVLRLRPGPGADDRSAMGSDDRAGVDFPAGPDGRRSTSATGRAVTAAALGEADPAAAQRAEREANWRAGYLTHFRALVEAGLASPAAATGV